MSIPRDVPRNEKALAKAPDHVKAQWHKAMALLEMGRWDDAWEIHESRLTGGADRVSDRPVSTVRKRQVP